MGVENFFGKIFNFISGGPPALRNFQLQKDQRNDDLDASGSPKPLPQTVEQLQATHHYPTAESELVKGGLMNDIPFQATSGGPDAVYHADPADNSEIFRRILLLLRLVTTISYGFPAWKLEKGKGNSSSRFHTQSYGYLDAITTLLLRRDEVVAAVESSPGSGIIMSPSGDQSMNPEVCGQFYFIPFRSNYPSL